jgi:hypothetical protein
MRSEKDTFLDNRIVGNGSIRFSFVAIAPYLGIIRHVSDNIL